jgi:hypothetical protein
MAMVVRDLLDGRAVISKPGTRAPFAYEVKCAGGCGRDMWIPIEYRLPDGSTVPGDPNEPRRCVVCGPFPKEK